MGSVCSLQHISQACLLCSTVLHVAVNDAAWCVSSPQAGADRVLAMDLHSGQCVGYFDIPVDHVYGESVVLDYLASKRIPTGDLVVVSPDVGGVARAR